MTLIIAMGIDSSDLGYPILILTSEIKKKSWNRGGILKILVVFFTIHKKLKLKLQFFGALDDKYEHPHGYWSRIDLC
jgi:hypothetical protein